MHIPLFVLFNVATHAPDLDAGQLTIGASLNHVKKTTVRLCFSKQEA
jgi:hypothetical protein